VTLRQKEPNELNLEDFPAPREGVIATYFLVVGGQDTSREWYRDVSGAKVVRERDPIILRFENSWLILNVGGATDDKPEVTLEAPSDPRRTSAFLNLRVVDVQQVFEEWSTRGAEFLTPGRLGSGDPLLYQRPRRPPHRGRTVNRHSRDVRRRRLDCV
jgi:lactoylglutathione lyase